MCYYFWIIAKWSQARNFGISWFFAQIRYITNRQFFSVFMKILHFSVNSIPLRKEIFICQKQNRFTIQCFYFTWKFKANKASVQFEWLIVVETIKKWNFWTNNTCSSVGFSPFCQMTHANAFEMQCIKHCPFNKCK